MAIAKIYSFIATGCAEHQTSLEQQKIKQEREHASIDHVEQQALSDAQKQLTIALSVCTPQKQSEHKKSQHFNAHNEDMAMY
jgi:hypothetical protein